MASISSSLVLKQLVARSATISKSSAKGGIILSSVIGLWTTGATGVAFVRCDDGDKDKIPSVIPTDERGNIDWNKALTDVTDGTTFDILARQSGAKIQHVISTGIPTNLSYGFICGYTSGFFLKKVGRVAAGVFGGAFVFLQTLAYNGYIKMDQEKAQETIENFLDLNDDGVVDEADRNLALEKLKKVLTYELPAGTGFACGFAGGVRSG